MECVIRFKSGQYVLRDRATGVEYSRGTEAQVRQAAQGFCQIIEAPCLQPVEFAGLTLSGFIEYRQLVDETIMFQGRLFTKGMNEWIGGILYPDRLGLSFAERLADIPQFVQGVQRLSGVSILSVSGIAAVAGIGDPPLLGNWIAGGYFQPVRLAARFEQTLGGKWTISSTLKYPHVPANGFWVIINRVPGT